MDINIKKYDYSGPTILEITNTRTYQHLALLVDRDDFKNDIKVIRFNVLSKYFGDIKTLMAKQVTDTPKEVIQVLEKYRYSSDLSKAIIAIIIRNKITNKDITNYKPNVGQPKNKLRDYMPHPIDIRLDKKIREHRDWYLTYMDNKNKLPQDYLGYKKISKLVNDPWNTIRTGINKYREKISINIS